MDAFQNSHYFITKVAPILEKMLPGLVDAQPNDAVNYMLDFLINQAGGSHCKAVQQHVVKCVDNGNIVRDGEDSDDDEDDVIEDLPIENLNKLKKPRASVSAESFNPTNKNFVPKVVPKDKDQADRIRAKIQNSFMFGALEEKEIEIVVGAMEEKIFKAGESVIKEGEDGDVLYVVDRGQLDCSKMIKGEQTYLKTYQPGESFGELALLYNAPRAASIIAKTDSILYALDRECFNNIVRGASIQKREKYESFLNKVPILESIDSYEKLQVADCLKSVKFNKDDFVITQGEKGDNFYIIEEGEAGAYKPIDGQEQCVLEYKPGDYFGELALLTDAPRAASIKATTNLTCVTLDRDSFNRLLGPLKEILKRNMDHYIKYNFQNAANQ